MNTTATPVTLKTTAVNAPGSAEPRELLQPKFFPGQLLTSDDLSALETWVKQRLALQHQNSGWGVVCGLEVTGDGQSPTRIHIAPGYAVDAAGQAIFVGQEYTACLGQFCGAMGCNDPSGSDCADDASDESLFQIGGYGVPRKYVRRIDLSLHYQTKDQDLRPVLPGPGKPPVCKPARMAETFEVHATPQPLPDAQGNGKGKQAPGKAQSATMDRCLQLLDDFGKRFQGLGSWRPNCDPSGALPDAKGKDVASWFRTQMASIPVGGFLFLPSLIDEIQAQDKALPWQAAEALFWLIQACRRQGAPCARCPDPSAGVPLARVWMYTSGDDCRILFIDGGQAYRRGLAPPFVTSKGDIDLTSFYGKEWSGVQVGLRGYGLTAMPEVARIPASPQGLQTLLRYKDATCPPISSAHPQQLVVALATRVPHWDGRVIGFYDAPTPRLPVLWELQDIQRIDSKDTNGRTGAAQPDGTNRTTAAGGLVKLAIASLPGDPSFMSSAPLAPPGSPSSSPPESEQWTFYLYDSLSGQIQPLNPNGTFSFTVQGDPPPEDHVQFTLLAVSSAGRDLQSTLWKSWTEIVPQ